MFCYALNCYPRAPYYTFFLLCSENCWHFVSKILNRQSFNVTIKKELYYQNEYIFVLERKYQIIFEPQVSSIQFYLIIFLYTCIFMSLDLGEVNSKELVKFRRRIIEEAFDVSQQNRYQMPRAVVDIQDDSIQEIPNLYNLHAQNHKLGEISILPIKELIGFRSKSHLNSTYLTTKKPSITRVEQESLRQTSRKSRLHCTLSKASSRQLVKSSPKSSWWCCCKEDKLQQFETKQITMKQDSRQTKMLAKIFQTASKNKHKRPEF